MKFPRSVYAIQHNVTKRIYIGSSSEVETRYMHHIYQLRSGKHSIEDMQSDFINYGEDYSFFILDEIKKYDERFKEYEWMEKYQTHKRGIGYNYKDIVFSKASRRNVIPLKEGFPESLVEGGIK